ncbi:unnamed protein product [Caenorhabditis sp. 36 PRJEB53466]|nr:unnamed protein product [Caenorhabditis sp. 36 PRJEB53466]
MTSLLGGNFSEVLHTALTSQLNVLSQKTSDSDAPTTFSSSSSSDSPPYDSMMSLSGAGLGEQTSGLTLDMFKDGLFASLVHPPPTDVAHSDTASSESPEPAAHPHLEHDDVANGTPEEHQQSAALSLIQSFGTPLVKLDDSEPPQLEQNFFSEATIRDLMPVLAAAQGSGGIQHQSIHSAAASANNTSSPSAWARNAGRKKSHPVWDFFKDLKDTTGSGGVICLHCSWSGDDRSPNNLRTHLKKFHSDDGIFNRFNYRMTRRKQDCTLAMEPLRTPQKTQDDSAFFDSANSVAGEELDVSQVMALLEQTNDGMLKGGKNASIEKELSPLTAARANEILFAAGIRPHKKTSEIWEHYKCLNEKQNVECIYCWKVLKRNDSSTKSMWGHMNAYHQDVLRDGTTRKKIKRPAGSTNVGLDLDETPTQPYVKRVRGGGSSTSNGLPSMVKMEQKPVIDMAFLQQLQASSGALNDTEFSFGGPSLNFLDSLPKSSEVININSGFVKMEEAEEDAENHVEAASSSSSDEPVRNVDSPEARRSPRAHSSQQEQNDQLVAFVNSLSTTNPMMFAMLNAAGGAPSASSHHQPLPPATLPPAPPRGATPTDPANGSMSPSKLEKDPSSFSLSEGHCAAQLMSMALDLEMTMSYHRRRIDIELCFESNRTAEKSGGRGKVICLTDLGKEIKITERVNGAICDTELWTKTDFNQFHWAIRGKCQKCFNKQ